MTEDCGNLEASWTLDIHEKGIWTLYKSLQLVGSGFKLSTWVQQISRHFLRFLLNNGALRGTEDM